MDAKKVAVAIGIAALLPLFLGLFIDAVYPQPVYNDYCKSSNNAPYTTPAIPSKQDLNCSDIYSTPEYQNCSQFGGNPMMNYSSGCPVYSGCDLCNMNFQNVQQLYNRNVFFILAPIGLIIVIIGIYLTVDYIGVGLMFAGLITMFYATVRYFSDMSKLLRALVILAELLIIIWMAYKKMGKSDVGKPIASKNKSKRGK